MSDKKTSGVFGGLAWTFAERITAQLVSTIVGIVLARLLTPEHYGIISIVMVFITLCNVFVTSGFGVAIVQKKEVDERDYNTAFLMSFSLSLLLYFVLFWAAPIIGNFYQMPELPAVIRVLGLRLIVASVNTIQQAYIQRTMQFKKFFISTSFGTVLSGIIGIYLAVKGFGIWALVAQYLTNTTVDTIVLANVGGWHPGRRVSIKKAKEIYSFGWKVLCTQLVFTLGGDIQSLIVGKVFGPSDLAYYDQGKKYPALLVNNINTSIQKVLLPALSRKQDNQVALKSTLRKFIKVGMFVLCPLVIGFAAVSDSFVRVVLTDKWASVVQFIVIFCFSYLTRPIESACHQAILAIGKSGLVFWIMVAIHMTSLIGTLFSTFVLRSVLWVALFSLASTVISLICFLIATRINIDYRLNEQLQDIIPAISISIIMGVFVYFLGRAPFAPWTVLLIQIVAGGIIYWGMAKISKNESYLYIRKMVLSKGLT